MAKFRVTWAPLALAIVSACSPPPVATERLATGEAASPAPAQPVAAPVGAAGDSIVAAKALSVGMADAGKIVDEKKSDFYRFDNKLNVRDLATVRLDNQSATLKPYFKIYDEDRAQIAEQYNSTPGASAEAAIAIEPGKPIYVEILPQNSLGGYRLSVTLHNSADAFEPNDDVLHAAAGAIGKDISAGIMDKKDFDYFRFSGAAKGQISVTLDNQSTSLRPNVKVFDANKAELVEKYQGTPGANLSFTVEVKPGEDVYVAVLPYDSAGAYKLVVK